MTLAGLLFAVPPAWFGVLVPHYVPPPPLELALTITTPADQIHAGSSIQIEARLAGANGLDIAAWQTALTSSVGGAWTVTDGPVASAAKKQFTCAMESGVSKCLQCGMNANIYGDGVVGTYTLAIPADAAAGEASIDPSHFQAASATGSARSIAVNSVRFSIL